MKNPLHALNNFHRAHDNSATAIKVKLRREMLAALASTGAAASVLDCFCGGGVMACACYAGLPYVGIDKKHGTDNLKYAADSTLSGFTFYDMDAYGSAMPLLEIVATKCDLPAAFVLTDGTRLHVQMMHRLPEFYHRFVKGGGRRSDGWNYAYPGIVKMTVRSLFAERGTVTNYRQYTARRKHNLYIGFTVEKKEKMPIDSNPAMSKEG